MPRLVLYHLSWCGYCRRVRHAADRLGVDLELVEVGQHPEARAKLIRELGRGTVPVLGIHEHGTERLLPESRDIIRYLESLVAESSEPSAR